MNVSKYKIAHWTSFFSLVLFSVFTLTTYSCKKIDVLNDSIQDAIQVLDDAVADMTTESANWRAILEDVVADLPETTHNVKSEVSQLINESIGATSSNIICVMDAIPTRIVRKLNELKAKLALGGVIPVLAPTVCQVSLPIIDLNNAEITRRTITVNGYDFDNANLLTLVLRKNSGATQTLSNRINKQSNYQYTINVANMDALLAAYDQIAIVFGEVDISQFGIIHKEEPIIQTIEFRPADFGPECPTHIGGDREFDGHGPDVTARTSIYIVNGKEIWADVYFHVKETVSDWTEAKGEWKYKIWPTIHNTAPANYKIRSILSASTTTKRYEDTDHSPDIINGSGPVDNFICVGDTGGDDVGRCNGNNDANISVQYNVIRISVEID